MALKPEDVREKQVENKTVKEDKIKKDARNLFLSREGLVREGTQAAIGVSKEDLQIRTQGEKRKKVSKGQLISKCLFSVFNSSKNEWKQFDLR